MPMEQELFAALKQTGKWDRIKSNFLLQISQKMANELTPDEARCVNIEYRVAQQLFASLEHQLESKKDD